MNKETQEGIAKLIVMLLSIGLIVFFILDFKKNVSNALKKGVGYDAKITTQIGNYSNTTTCHYEYKLVNGEYTYTMVCD